MEQQYRYKKILIGGLLVFIFVMAVGYAAFITSLNINGTANITSKWDIHIESIKPTTTVGTASSKSSIVGDDKLSATFVTDLISPGDSITYTITVKNDGTLNAKLNNIKLTLSDDTPDAAIEYSHTAENLKTTVLEVGKIATFTVTVTYKNSVETQPTTEHLKNELAMQLTYNQATTESKTETEK